MTSDSGVATDRAADGPAKSVMGLTVAVIGLFFLFGGLTSLNDVLIPKLKGLFNLDHRAAMLVQSAFFAAYFVVSFPAGLIVQRIGYLRAAVLGLVAMAVGCLLFIPASHGGFGLFLFALFVVGTGITIVQVVSNPLISALGPARTASSRLTFAQAFNSLGTTIMPWIGATLILGSLAKAPPGTVSRGEETAVIGHAYLGLAIVLILVAGVIWLGRNAYDGRGPRARFRDGLALLGRPRFAFGTLCIFLYVGAEVAIGSSLALFLMQPQTLGLGPEAAGRHISYYWGGALIGRFVGAALLQKLRPGWCLSAVAIGALVLLGFAGFGSGNIAAWALIAVGLMNAIQFPTIFSLASEGLGNRAAEGSGIICMAIVGGAVVPLLTGWAADHVGLGEALAVPAVCYVAIALFGLYAQRPAPGAPEPASR